MTRPTITRQEVTQMLGAIYPDLFTSNKVIVFGLRGFFDAPGQNRRGIYDDAIGIITPDLYAVFNANTDPSITRKGIAVLQDGIYKYAQGLHGMHHLDESKLEDQKILHTLLQSGKDYPKVIPGRTIPYWALRQSGPVTVLRDGATAPETVTDPAKYPFIDIHKGGYNTTSSEGCQTIHPDQWQEFYWDTVVPAMEKWKQAIIPYALLTKKS